jgi:hypothetical protein
VKWQLSRQQQTESALLWVDAQTATPGGRVYWSQNNRAPHVSACTEFKRQIEQLVIFSGFLHFNRSQTDPFRAFMLIALNVWCRQSALA